MEVFENKKSTIFIILFILLSFSCSGQIQQMSAVDKAAITAQEFSKTYLSLYASALRFTTDGTPSQRQYLMEKVNPKLNEAKKAIVIMDEAVALWKKTGIDTMDAKKKQEDLNILLQDISLMLIERTQNERFNYRCCINID